MAKLIKCEKSRKKLEEEQKKMFYNNSRADDKRGARKRIWPEV